jgi:hypothetical protein
MRPLREGVPAITLARGDQRPVARRIHANTTGTVQSDGHQVETDGHDLTAAEADSRGATSRLEARPGALPGRGPAIGPVGQLERDVAQVVSSHPAAALGGDDALF